MSVFVDCPTCNVPVKINQTVKLGDTISCTACKAALEVVWLDPIELDVLIDDDEFEEIYDDSDDVEDPYDDYEYSVEEYDV